MRLLAHWRANSALVCALLATRPALAACPPVSLLPRTQYTIASAPIEGVLADVTGDGRPDLVFTCSDPAGSANRISILPGVGTPAGGFGSRFDILVSGTPFALATSDLNQDGRVDLVVTMRNLNQVQVFLGTGGGAFSAPLSFDVGSSPYEVALGDFNEDGVTDIVVADNGELAISVLLGGSNGSGQWTGGFAPAVNYPTNNLSLAVATGDVNSDGITDVFATEYNAGTIAVFLGQGAGGVGNGTFGSALHIPAGTEPYDIATGDLNGDGKLDLAVASGGPGGLQVLLGSGSGFFPVHDTYLAGVSCSGVSIRDLDVDGAQDLAVSSALGDAVYTLRGVKTTGVPNGTFDSPTIYSACCFPVHVFTGDINEDGKPDVMTCDYQASSTSVFLNGCVPPPPPNPNSPSITSVRDVPNDQGGRLQLTWSRSLLDVTGGTVTGYRVWRRVPAGSASARAIADDPTRPRRTVAQRPDGTQEIIYWEAVAVLPAQRLSGYGYTASTPQDSLAGSNPYAVFFITATTNNIDLFYDSDPDSGYSIDNLAPAPPSGLAANASGGGTAVHWLANPESDLHHYELHRGTSSTFVPSGATLVATPSVTTFEDAAPAGSSVYKLAAVDVHGNRGGFSTLLGTQVTAVGGGRPGITSLAVPAPNPSRGALDVSFALAQAGRVQLRVMDAQGRVVRTLVDGIREAGESRLRWDGTNDAGHGVCAGLYWLRLATRTEQRVQRVIRMR